MLKQPDEYEALFQEVKADLQSSDEKKVLIFVSTADCDSVCAVRLLQLLLINSGIHFSVYPVGRTASIQHLCDVHLTGEAQTVILINCGGQVHLENLLRLEERPETRVIVIDSHRPLHHNAADVSNAIYLVDAEECQAILAIIPAHDGASDCDDGLDEVARPSPSHEGDEEEEDKENERPAQRQRVSPEASHPGARRREWKLQVRKRRKAYYDRGHPFGKPAALTMYDLAQQLHMDCRHYLWLAILGLTDQLVHQRLDSQKYDVAIEELEMLVNQQQEDDDENEDMQPVPVYDGHGNVLEFMQKRIRFGQIRAADDFKFPLMRHWSLYDSIIHSRYVAARLGTWQDKGRDRMDELLVRMGFSQRDCKQDYCVTARKFTNLSQKLREHAETYRLKDLTFRSFRLAWGTNAPLYAADVVLAVTALLEAPPAKKPVETALTDDSNENFWAAWNATAIEGTGDLRKGIESSKRLQKAILSDGGLLMASKAGQSRAKFVFYDLNRHEITNKAILSHPLALVKLGMFLRDVHRERMRQSKAAILIGPANADGNCLIVAVAKEHDPDADTDEGNIFGVLFRRTADSIGAQYHLEGFDSSVIQIAVSYTARFMRELTVMCASRRFDAAAQPAAPDRQGDMDPAGRP